MKARRNLYSVAILAVALLAATARPSASLIIPIDLGNQALSGLPTPFGSVTVTLLTPTTATIEFLSNTGPINGLRYAFGASGVTGFNLADNANVNVASWSWTAFHGGSPNITAGGAANEDGFGLFNQTFDNFDGFTNSVSEVKFNLARTSGTWGTDADILTPNGSGNSVAAHIFVANQDYTNYGVTGFASSGLTTIPEPASLFTLGSGLLGFGLLQLRRRKKA